VSVPGLPSCFVQRLRNLSLCMNHPIGHLLSTMLLLAGDDLERKYKLGNYYNEIIYTICGNNMWECEHNSQWMIIILIKFNCILFPHGETKRYVYYFERNCS